MKKVLIILSVLLISFLLFKVSVMQASRGDAPFLPRETRELFLSEPSIWVTRGNSFGGVNEFIWIYPYMSLLSHVSNLVNLTNNTTLLLFFYFPSIALSLTGAFLLSRSFRLNFFGSLFASLIATFNTYFLLLIDGGQVGIALAYGIFPIVIYFAKLSAETNSRKNRLLFFVFCLVLNIIDPRINLICLFFALILLRKSFLKLIPMLLIIAGISLYWIYPLLSVSPDKKDLGATSLQLTSFLNGLHLWNPHWYKNIFGVVSYPNLTTVIIPIATILGFTSFNKQYRLRLLASYLIFVFLIKGTTPPVGQVYELFVTKFPLGYAFRDSTKFFIPLIFITSVLIGRAVEKTNYKKVAYLFLLFIPYFVVLMIPLVRADILSTQRERSHIELVNSIQSVGYPRKVIWFPEKFSTSLDTKKLNSIDGRDLVNFRPFARINTGDSDKFNFLDHKASNNLLHFFGAKYLVFTDRNVPQDEKGHEDSLRLRNRMNEREGYDQIGKVKDTYLFKSTNVDEDIVGYEKLIAVVGPDNVLEKPELINNAYVFLEDGKVDAKTIFDNRSSNDINIIFEGKDKTDLALSFLQNYFVASSELESGFAYYGTDQYLKYKYELLIREVEFSDFDYGKGIYFSSVAGEKIELSKKLSKGKYIVAVRMLGKSSRARVNVSDKSEEIVLNSDSLAWYTWEVNLDNDTLDAFIENVQGLLVVNTVAIIPVDELKRAQIRAEEVVKDFSGNSELAIAARHKVSAVYESENEIRLEVPDAIRWIVFKQSYHPLWKLNTQSDSSKSVPVYSSINGFYINSESDNAKLIFEGQMNLRQGMLLAIITTVMTTFIAIAFYRFKHK